ERSVHFVLLSVLRCLYYVTAGTACLPHLESLPGGQDILVVRCERTGKKITQFTQMEFPNYEALFRYYIAGVPCVSVEVGSDPEITTILAIAGSHVDGFQVSGIKYEAALFLDFTHGGMDIA